MKTNALAAEIACLDELRNCLETERMCLLLYRTDTLLENNSLKENLTENLNQLRLVRREEISDVKITACAEGEEWFAKNRLVSELCSSNAKFIESSLKRQALLMDNLRKLMGGPSIYSKSGNKSHSVVEGRVIANRY